MSGPSRATTKLRFAAVALLLHSLPFLGTELPGEHHKYCIIGAGPAGAQLGHFLHKAGRDYVILDRAPRAASWFSTFPIHRQLNSINRRYTRSGDAEFNLRHDWNSLIGSLEAGVELFGSWTKEYWPAADILVEYINAFLRHQTDAGHVRFCHTVTAVSRCDASLLNCGYKLSVRLGCPPPEGNATCNADGGGAGCSANVGEMDMTCQVLVMANGMWLPRVVDDWILDLSQHSVRYDQLKDIPVEEFENKSVLILGAGNAATETADAVRNYARDLQIAGRFDIGKLMRDTRYVGHIRGRRTTHMDANSVKSYEGHTPIPFSAKEIVMVRCGPEDGINSGFMGELPVCVFDIDEDGDVLLVPILTAHKELIKQTHALFPGLVFEKPPNKDLAIHARLNHELLPSALHIQPTNVLCIRLADFRGSLTLDQRKILPLLRDRLRSISKTGTEFAKPIDVVITCLGWRFDASVFDASVDLEMIGKPPSVAARNRHNGPTYPKLTGEFESTSARGLFFAGAAAHGRDRYRYQASGGFIHGFRFNCRSLWRILEGRYEERASDNVDSGESSYPWSHQGPQHQLVDLADFGSSVASVRAKSELWGKLVQRVNIAAGPYEMVGGSLVDAIVYDCNGKATYLEDVTEDTVHDRYVSLPRVTWSYYFGCTQCRLDGEVFFCQIRSARHAALGGFVHPVLQYFPAGLVSSGWQSRDARAKQAELRGEHPSAFWKKERGVSRLHVREEYMHTDWTDAETLGQIDFFMSHVEAGVRSYCSNGSAGLLSRAFDEAADFRLFENAFADKFDETQKKAAQQCKRT